MRSAMLALQFSILATVFGFGLRAATGDALYLVERPGLLGRTLLAMFVVMPLIALLLSRAFDFSPTTRVALVALSIAPIPPLLPKKLNKAGSESSYAIALMATVALLSIVIVPLSVHLLGRYFGFDLSGYYTWFDPQCGHELSLTTDFCSIWKIRIRNTAPTLSFTWAGYWGSLLGVDSNKRFMGNQFMLSPRSSSNSLVLCIRCR